MKETRIAKIPQKISRTTLRNGSLMIGEEIEYLHSFIFGIYVKTGSDNEPVQHNGISHMVEHLLFKGTKKRSAEKAALDIESLGGMMNAYTARDHTCFYVKSMPKNFPKIFKIIQEMIYQPLIDAKELEKEKNVILEELKSALDDPEDLAFQNLNQIIFEGSRFEKSIIGTEESVKKLSKKTVDDYIDKYYTNKNMFYSYAGPMKYEDASVIFNDENRRAGGALTASGKKILFHKSKFKYEFKESLQQFHVVMGVKSGGFTSKDRYALMMLISILGAGMSSRLFRILREKNGLVYTVYSFTESFNEAGTTGIYFACNEKNINKTLKMIDIQLNRIKENGVSRAEIEKVKNQLLTNLAMNYDSLSGRMSLIARSILYNDKLIGFDDILAEFEKITQEEIQEAALRYFDFDSFNFSIVGSKEKFKL
jgi:predicted Zn-dependent peptidase